MRRMPGSEDGKVRAGNRLVVAISLAGALVLPSGGSAQVASDTTGLGGRFGTMSMLLEKTFLQVDVLDLEIRTDSVTAGRIAAILNAGAVDGAAGDSIARVMLRAPAIWARMSFKRGIGVDRLIQEIRNSMRNAVEAGLLDQSALDVISGSLPEWYAPLEDRGVRDGDAQYYRIEGDTLRTMYVGREGETWIDATATRPANRTALLASWFARGSDFREKLLDSLPRS